MRDQDFIEGMQENLAALVACLLSLPAEVGIAMYSTKPDLLSLEHPRQSLLLSMQHQLDLWSLIKPLALFHLDRLTCTPSFMHGMSQLSVLPCDLQVLHVPCSAALRLSKALCYQGGLRFFMLDE